jgi:hypothetical protein
LRRRAEYEPRDPEVGELVDAILDVQLQPSKRLHQRFDIEGLVRSRVEISQDTGAQAAIAQVCETVYPHPPVRPP